MLNLEQAGMASTKAVVPSMEVQVVPSMEVQGVPSMEVQVVQVVPSMEVQVASMVATIAIIRLGQVTKTGLSFFFCWMII